MVDGGRGGQVVLAKIKPLGWIINQGKSDRDTSGRLSEFSSACAGVAGGGGGGGGLGGGALEVKPFSPAPVASIVLITRNKEKTPPPSLPPSLDLLVCDHWPTY